MIDVTQVTSIKTFWCGAGLIDVIQVMWCFPMKDLEAGGERVFSQMTLRDGKQFDAEGHVMPQILEALG